MDVGANDGLYAASLRDAGYHGRIISFEPQSAEYARLAARAADDPAWETRNVALSAAQGSAVLHLAGNSSSSSLLEMGDLHAATAPESRYVGEEVVPIARLDSAIPDTALREERGYLKIDVQGSELDVLRGAGDLLDRIDAVEVELSLARLYEGAPLFPEVLAYLESQGFVLLWLEPVFSDPATGRLLQLDGVFARPMPRRSVV